MSYACVMVPKGTEEFEQVGDLGVRIRSLSINNRKGITMYIMMCGTESWISADIQDYRFNGLILKIRKAIEDFEELLMAFFWGGEVGEDHSDNYTLRIWLYPCVKGLTYGCSEQITIDNIILLERYAKDVKVLIDYQVNKN